jgi:hypothetical protein
MTIVIPELKRVAITLLQDGVLAIAQSGEAKGEASAIFVHRDYLRAFLAAIQEVLVASSIEV